MTGCKANSMLSQRTFPQGEDGTDNFLFTEKNSLAIYGYNIQNSQNMDKQKIHYCFTLSDAQMEYLRCKNWLRYDFLSNLSCIKGPLVVNNSRLHFASTSLGRLTQRYFKP